MPSHNFDLNDPKNTLRVLLAITLEAGGELRIKAPSFDSIDRGRLLLIDFDKKKNEIVLRATTDFGRVAVVQPENASWVKPIEAAPLERARVQAERDAEQSGVKSDEELAALEEEMARRQEVARLAKAGKVPMRLKTVK